MTAKNLGNLSPAPGSHRNTKRIGRGIGSGTGKTAGKGHKGQKARKGGKVAPGFEGGQTPMYRRLPKRGFTNPFKVKYNIVNLDVLDRFDANTRITPEFLKEQGLIKNTRDPIKLLGRGEVSKSFTIALQKVSASAKDAVVKAGGSIEEI